MMMQLLNQLNALYHSSPLDNGWATDEAVLIGAAVGLGAVYFLGCPKLDANGNPTNQRAPLTFSDTLRCTLGTAVEGLKTGLAIDAAWLIAKPTWNYLVAPALQVAYETVSHSLAHHLR
ncbi:hypothetical protein [Candidatus Berkiella aquae]|uniref:Uncharacterized protein n=1 Tax=Candidatus Berkiella aquae TaxID=295108 RepID=A0A0Q9YUE1_9GAMM|nr:hypothetical protein [Candidatus Berkiella aquae]MCS5710157.1 hypothetical protein [Candidatus Berkiella aquae]